MATSGINKTICHCHCWCCCCIIHLFIYLFICLYQLGTRTAERDYRSPLLRGLKRPEGKGRRTGRLGGAGRWSGVIQSFNNNRNNSNNNSNRLLMKRQSNHHAAAIAPSKSLLPPAVAAATAAWCNTNSSTSFSIVSFGFFLWEEEEESLDCVSQWKQKLCALLIGAGDGSGRPTDRSLVSSIVRELRADTQAPKRIIKKEEKEVRHAKTKKNGRYLWLGA